MKLFVVFSLTVRVFFSYGMNISSKYPVSFFLYTKENSNQPIYLTQTNLNQINVKTPIKIIVHGYFETVEKDWYRNIKNEYLKKGNYNVIQTDWSQLAFGLYSSSSRNTELVGNIIGDVIISLHTSYGLDLRNVHLIGHSLGSHVCGYAGKKVKNTLKKKVARISALDPAGPLFEFPFSLLKGLEKDDAELVDVIHTDGGIFGRRQPVGTVDFYPNGGIALQPGCDLHYGEVRTFTDLQKKLFCSHTRSYIYFINSINNIKYKGFKCKSWTMFKENKCSKSVVAVMGDDYEYKPELTGTFYLYARPIL